MSTDREKVVKMLKDTTGICGPPGCGKTYGIKDLQHGDVLLASTSGAKRRLKNLKGHTKARIMSVEAFQCIDFALDTRKRVIIDEANAAHWMVTAIAVERGFRKM